VKLSVRKNSALVALIRAVGFPLVCLRGKAFEFEISLQKWTTSVMEREAVRDVLREAATQAYKSGK